jgi:uncharacterized protein with GYD domain
MQFIISLTRTDQGRRSIKDTAKRVQGARELGKKMGVEIEHVFFTSGDTDIVTIVNAAWTFLGTVAVVIVGLIGVGLSF